MLLVSYLFTQDNTELVLECIMLPETEQLLATLETTIENLTSGGSGNICSALRKLFGLPTVNLINPNLVIQALQWHELGLDFADAFHLAQSQNYPQFYTFDDKFVKRAKGLTSCEVKKP